MKRLIIAFLLILFSITTAFAASNKERVVDSAALFTKVFDSDGQIRKGIAVDGGELFSAGYFLGMVSIGIEILAGAAEYDLTFPAGETVGMIAYKAAVAVTTIKDRVKDDNTNESVIVLAAIMQACNAHPP